MCIRDSSYRNIVFTIDPGTEEIEIVGSQIAGVSYLIEKEESDMQAAIEAEEQAIAYAEAEEAEIISILEESCGEGTILKDGVCVLENPPVQSTPINPTPLIYGIFGAMGIGLAVVLILWGIGKRSNKEIPADSN